MGLFGSSPQKKLEKARALSARHSHYDALLLYEELLQPGVRLSPVEEAEAREGWHAVRSRMIEDRLLESEGFRQSGDLERARDRCRTALDLAGNDIDPEPIRRQMLLVDAPRRPPTSSGRPEDASEDDLLPEADEVVAPKPGPFDRPEPPRPAKSDAELFGDDPAALFEVYMNTVDEETAALYRGLGDDFRLGYLALVQGEGARALDFFDRMDWSRPQNPKVILDRAHALLLAGRAEECLDLLSELSSGPSSAVHAPTTASQEMPSASEETPGASAAKSSSAAEEGEETPEGRLLFLKVEALRALGRFDEAVAAARVLVGRSSQPSAVLSGLLGWTLLEAGRPQEAYDALEPWLGVDLPPEEVLVPAAQAAVALEHRDEAIRLLEALVDQRVQRSIRTESEMEFPVEAGRRLLELYQEEGTDAGTLRSLLLHLIDHDPDRGESYRELLLSLDSV